MKTPTTHNGRLPAEGIESRILIGPGELAELFLPNMPMTQLIKLNL